MEDRALREQLPRWIGEMRKAASVRPATGACAVGTAFELWTWTFLRTSKPDADGKSTLATASPSLAEALGWLLSARALVLDCATTEDGSLLIDVCHAHVARTCGEVARICAELVFGSLRHPTWDADSHICYHASDLDMLDDYVPGLAASARAYSDVIETDGSHPEKAGPCVRFEGVEEFVQLRARLDGCLAGSHLARQRAARRLETL